MALFSLELEMERGCWGKRGNRTCIMLCAATESHELRGGGGGGAQRKKGGEKRELNSESTMEETHVVVSGNKMAYLIEGREATFLKYLHDKIIKFCVILKCVSSTCNKLGVFKDFSSALEIVLSS